MVFAGDLGIGLGHIGYRSFCDPGACTGLGMNLEAALGATERVEIGLRTGIRFGDAGRATSADSYGRTLWTETFGTGSSVVANPELRVRWGAYRGSVAEIGIDGRLYLPFETGTRLGMMFGVPLAFHVGDSARIDTGVYVPVLFSDPLVDGISVPLDVWFQASGNLWLGPMTALRAFNGGNAHLLLGFGLGYQAARSVDLKTMLLFPNVDDGRQFGFGFGVQFRAE
jgi:hypothetical protein